MQVEGLFTNSATTNSKCGFFIKDTGTGYTVSIYPYNNSSKERWVESTYQNVKIKTPSGGVLIINSFCYKKGVVLLSDEMYAEIKKTISEVGKYIFLLKYKSDYSESSYRFNFTID